MNNMDDANTFGIYKRNQLLFLEAGFIHLNTIISGVFIPFYGLSFIFVSIATYFVYCFMAAMLSSQETKFEDFFNVISLDAFPSAIKNILVCVGLLMVTLPIVLFYNQNYISYPFNSAACTLTSSLLGGLAYVLANKKGNAAVAISFFTVVSIPLVFLSLIIGGVITLPLLFIFFYRRA